MNQRVAVSTFGVAVACGAGVLLVVATARGLRVAAGLLLAGAVGLGLRLATGRAGSAMLARRGRGRRRRRSPVAGAIGDCAGSPPGFVGCANDEVGAVAFAFGWRRDSEAAVGGAGASCRQVPTGLAVVGGEPELRRPDP